MSTAAPILSADASRLTPAALVALCRHAGHTPPGGDGPLRYVVLGTADGTLPLSVAAGDQNASVWAWDPHADQRELTRRRRDEAGISNLVVHEHRSLPTHSPFQVDGALADIVTIDGLLDRSSDAVRAQLFEFVADTLRPGGLLCISYRTTIGWQEMLPVVNLMRHAASTHRGDPSLVVSHVLALLERLIVAEPAYVLRRPRVAAWIAALFAADHRDIERAYLRDQFRPLSHAQVESNARRLGCTFVGDMSSRTAPSGEQVEALAALVHGAPTPVLRELYRDLASHHSHRSDVFRSGVN